MNGWRVWRREWLWVRKHSWYGGRVRSEDWASDRVRLWNIRSEWLTEEAARAAAVGEDVVVARGSAEERQLQAYGQELL